MTHAVKSKPAKAKDARSKDGDVRAVTAVSVGGA